MCGRYPQAERDKDEEIKWRVLKCGYDRVLVISEDLLDCQMYNRKRVAVTWETSWLREWMNKVFVFKAFNEEEIAKVAEVCSQNLDNPVFVKAEGGRATWDRLFVLSMEEFVISSSLWNFTPILRREAPSPVLTRGR